MAGLLEDAADFLRDTLLDTTIAGEAAVYSRGATTVALYVIPGSALLNVTDTQGVSRVIHTDRDYYLDPATMGALYPPQRGDKITVGTDVHEVLAMPGVSVWSDEDQFGRLIGVHTKRVHA